MINRSLQGQLPHPQQLQAQELHQKEQHQSTEPVRIIHSLSKQSVDHNRELYHKTKLDCHQDLELRLTEIIE